MYSTAHLFSYSGKIIVLGIQKNIANSCYSETQNLRHIVRGIKSLIVGCSYIGCDIRRDYMAILFGKKINA